MWPDGIRSQENPKPESRNDWNWFLNPDIMNIGLVFCTRCCSSFQMQAKVRIWPLTFWLCTWPQHSSCQLLLEDIQQWRPGSGSDSGGWSGLEERETIWILGRQTRQVYYFLFHVLIPVLSAALLRRSGPWETKWFALWMIASLLRWWWCWLPDRVEFIHPREHLVLGFPASHIMTEQLMYTWV